jgi:hypothetical protein
MSTVTLTDEDLHAMQELASNSLRDSLIEYRRLLSALREKCPTLTDAAISEIGKRGDACLQLLQGGVTARHAMYQAAASRASGW